MIDQSGILLPHNRFKYKFPNHLGGTNEAKGQISQAAIMGYQAYLKLLQNSRDAAVLKAERICEQFSDQNNI